MHSRGQGRNGNEMKNISKKKFYVLSFTYGLPMSIFGLIACGFFKLCGKEIKKYGHAYYVEFGKGTSGLELGWFFIVNKGTSDFLKRHELGHTYQNACIYGPIMPILGFVSLCRWCLKKIGAKIDYYKWFFEKQANEIGTAVMNDE